MKITSIGPVNHIGSEFTQRPLGAHPLTILKEVLGASNFVEVREAFPSRISEVTMRRPLGRCMLQGIAPRQGLFKGPTAMEIQLANNDVPAAEEQEFRRLSSLARLALETANNGIIVDLQGTYEGIFTQPPGSYRNRSAISEAVGPAVYMQPYLDDQLPGHYTSKGILSIRARDVNLGKAHDFLADTLSQVLGERQQSPDMLAHMARGYGMRPDEFDTVRAIINDQPPLQAARAILALA